MCRPMPEQAPVMMATFLDMLDDRRCRVVGWVRGLMVDMGDCVL